MSQCGKYWLTRQRKKPKETSNGFCDKHLKLIITNG
jgi:hypothetical protein